MHAPVLATEVPTQRDKRSFSVLDWFSELRLVFERPRVLMYR